MIPIIIYHLTWYSLLVSGALLWPVVGNKRRWRTLDGWKSILRNNDTHRRLQWGSLIFIGGQQVLPLISIYFQWLSLEWASVSSSRAYYWISTSRIQCAKTLWNQLPPFLGLYSALVLDYYKISLLASAPGLPCNAVCHLWFVVTIKLPFERHLGLLEANWCCED